MCMRVCVCMRVCMCVGIGWLPGSMYLDDVLSNAPTELHGCIVLPYSSHVFQVQLHIRGS